MRKLILLLVVCLYYPAQAQRVFTQNDLIGVVKKFHPLAKQAILNMRIADANVTESRGGFDPIVSFDNSRKDFSGITYYDHQTTQLKIPTWYGIDVYVGKETIEGSRLNPEETTGTIHFAGVSVPLVQNLIIDKRRAILQQAKIIRDQSEVSRRAVLNDLISEALLAYWDWWEKQQSLQVVQASLQNAKARMAMVKEVYMLGDRPAIDTLEAATQVQFFERQEAEASMLLQKSRLNLSLYLWTDNALTYDLPDDFVPETPKVYTLPLLDSLLNQAGVQPLLMEYDYKLKELDIEKRLKFQSLLPDVRARYNGMARNFSNTVSGGFFNNNYQFGLAVSMPLRISGGRGQYRAAKLIIEQTKVAQLSKLVSVQNKVKQYFIEWQQAIVQYNQQQKLVANYLALQKGEETRFANGESSLFLVNAREAKAIEERRKTLEMEAQIQKSAVRVSWAAGGFSNF